MQPNGEEKIPPDEAEVISVVEDFVEIACGIDYHGNENGYVRDAKVILTIIDKYGRTVPGYGEKSGQRSLLAYRRAGRKVVRVRGVLNMLKRKRSEYTGWPVPCTYNFVICTNITVMSMKAVPTAGMSGSATRLRLLIVSRQDEQSGDRTKRTIEWYTKPTLENMRGTQYGSIIPHFPCFCQFDFQRLESRAQCPAGEGLSAPA